MFQQLEEHQSNHLVHLYPNQHPIMLLHKFILLMLRVWGNPQEESLDLQQGVAIINSIFAYCHYFWGFSTTMSLIIGGFRMQCHFKLS